MPELPEIEVIRRSVAKVLAGERIKRVTVRRKNLRYPIARGLNRLRGKTFHRFNRRGKYLIAEFGNGDGGDNSVSREPQVAQPLVFHLGMSGRLRITEPDAPTLKHDHVHFATDRFRLAFYDPRRFGSLRWANDPSLRTSLEKLGEEPRNLTAEGLLRRLSGRRTAIKQLLLDQSLIAGLGNIYACEVLFAAAIAPHTAADELTQPRLGVLVAAINRTLKRAIAVGGSTIKDHFQPMGEAGYFQTEFKVYGRENLPCFVCKSPIIRIVRAGRATFHCPECQK